MEKYIAAILIFTAFFFFFEVAGSPFVLLQGAGGQDF